MSDTSDIYNLNFEVFGSFLEQMNVSPVCKECGQTDSKIMIDEKNYASTTDTNLQQKGSILINREAYPCYVVTCFNCGYTRLFNASVVHNRMKSMKGDA